MAHKQTMRVTVNTIGVGSILTRGNKIFSFLCSCVEAKCSIESRRAILPEFGGEWKVECSDTSLPAYPATCGIQREYEKKLFKYQRL